MSRKQRANSAQPAVIDACCLIDLLASGQADAILNATGHVWYLPVAVQAEIQYVRKKDPELIGACITIPADLEPLLKSGIVTICQPDDRQEQARFVHYATVFRSDGESMCLALGECRGWVVATDDRKAIKIAERAGMQVKSCPELVKAWADVERPDKSSLSNVLSDIQTLAQFRPNPEMREFDWWVGQLT